MKLKLIENRPDCNRDVSFNDLIVTAQRVMHDLTLDRKLIGIEDMFSLELYDKAQLMFYKVYRYGIYDHQSIYLQDLAESIILNDQVWDISHIYISTNGDCILVCYKDDTDDSQFVQILF